MGIVDYTSRLAADVIKTSYRRDADESRLYAFLVWGLVLVGVVGGAHRASTSRSYCW